MRRRVISVTRRHLEFLFGVSNVKQVRVVERIIKRNREETVMKTGARVRYVGEQINEAWPAEKTGTVTRVAPNGWIDIEWDGGGINYGHEPQHFAEGDWQLPPSDESKVGDDV